MDLGEGRKVSPAGREPDAHAVFQNDGPGYEIQQLTFVYFYLDRAPVVHRHIVSLPTSGLQNDHAGTFAKCVCIMCVAYAALPNGSHRFLTQRTEYYDNSGGWDAYRFAVSEMREGPN
jgi:hypothetical protein